MRAPLCGGAFILQPLDAMARSHLVDFSGLLAGGRQLMLVDDAVPIEPFEGIEFPRPALLHLEVRCADRMLAVAGRVEALARGRCDSCLVDVERELGADIDERFDPAVQREDEPFGENNVLTGNRLDVADLAQQLLLSALPLGLRCRDDCKGLCPMCGANRNGAPCSCENGEKSG